MGQSSAAGPCMPRDQDPRIPRSLDSTAALWRRRKLHSLFLPLGSLRRRGLSGDTGGRLQRSSWALFLDGVQEVLRPRDHLSIDIVSDRCALASGDAPRRLEVKLVFFYPAPALIFNVVLRASFPKETEDGDELVLPNLLAILRQRCGLPRCLCKDAVRIEEGPFALPASTVRVGRETQLARVQAKLAAELHGLR
eukprot:scaffold944_cov240-Pinguiococcus_pyrenoidosus.AAC.1